MNISVVIPLFNEEESIKELSTWIVEVMKKNKFSYEIILIDDGSDDTSWKEIERLNSKNSNIKGVKFRRNYGKSAALNIGFLKAKGDVVITMDADLQDSPDEIPKLYEKVYKKVLIWYLDGKKNDMIQFPKQFLQSYLIGQPEKHREYIFMISIVVSRHIIKML